MGVGNQTNKGQEWDNGQWLRVSGAWDYEAKWCLLLQMKPPFCSPLKRIRIQEWAPFYMLASRFMMHVAWRTGEEEQSWEAFRTSALFCDANQQWFFTTATWCILHRAEQIPIHVNRWDLLGGAGLDRLDIVSLNSNFFRPR